ncbi:long-chain-fatty-acid--CoA ligase [Paraliomyxa miuraensis]|uniref:long-chain-fatty-acid--CoA ligase n=1 Tax=Paraliomyxa miuraensis TaxID=376150 RepID=UPI00224CC0E2|nr:long-chain fatty acid--CoA ligase [Paraliomyxa miuraensis]MCX4244867.1 long-chain fatty acid--CoA ligase [Paraliomyxa miuraensis]
MSLNLASILRSSARTWPDRTAVIIGQTELTYAQLHGMARRFAWALQGLGVEPGQHVALMLPNVPQFIAAYFGAHYAGCTVVPLNVLLTGPEVAYHLRDSDAVALVVWEGFLEHAHAGAARVDDCKHLIVAKADPTDLDEPAGARSFNRMLATATPVEDLPATNPDDTAVILYTSGTTGQPKGAELTHFNLFYNALYSRDKLCDMSVDTVALVTLPLFHSFGQTVLQNAVLGAGGTLVLLPRFTPQDAFALMQAHHVTLFAGVPTMYFALLHHPEADRYDLSSLQRCVSGGSAMPVEVMKAFDDKYGVDILEGYGLSETSPVASFNRSDRPKKPGSIGLPIEDVEFRLVDDDGHRVEESGKPGEIWIFGPNVMKGYYNKPEATHASIQHGWFRTGDVATRDDDGFYFIVDRKKDMIIRGGFNVYPREIEEVLYAHPAVVEAAVIGMPHPKHGEEVMAVLALREGHTATAEEIVEYCKQNLAAYKYPRLVEFRDSLPKGATGKILKRVLRDELVGAG